ncbi:TerD family protein [Paenibacillus sp. GCM10023248]|uniref:TerD family protein n=1 Tax=Bacillales TaxID=1385 RepID=UPI0023797D54|nr:MULTISPECIES: TerD family protein [Bacillales]MDD9271223.1 TerD family protein [Paenibacillus sp. MAHUQ-63]MDR6881657.1 tellurite resistance protein TerA [Bacillus sp. 3255]
MHISVVKGQKADVTKTNPGLTKIGIGIGWNAPASHDLDTSAFLLGASGKVDNDEQLVFYNNPTKNGVSFIDNPNQGGDRKQFSIQLTGVPANVEKVAFTLTIHDGEKLKQQFSQVTQAYIRIFHPETGQDMLRYELGNHFSVETAIVVGELYRYGAEWKFSAIGSGFSGGLKALCGNFGIEVKDEPSAPVPGPAPVQQTPPPSPPPVTPPTPVNLTKIELKKKGDRISLEKKPPGRLGEILINLNWNQKKSTGFFGKSKGIDLDLACLYELKNGEKGVIQALGNRFGSLTREPYIALDGDDRTGSVKTGENIRINGNKLAEFERILVFTFIYEGATTWSEADGVVSIKQDGGPDIEVKLNEHDNRQGMCAIALIRNQNNETFSIERLVQYFSGHKQLDEAFGWGMRWVAGSK